MYPLRASLIIVRSTGRFHGLPLSASARDGSIAPGKMEARNRHHINAFNRFSATLWRLWSVCFI